MPLQPFIERRLTAIEIVKLVLSSKPLGPPIRHGLVEDASIREELGQTRHILGLTVERRRKPFPVVVVEDEARMVTQNPVRLHHSRIDDEVRQ
jgi:hypothetical protein